MLGSLPPIIRQKDAQENMGAASETEPPVHHLQDILGNIEKCGRIHRQNPGGDIRGTGKKLFVDEPEKMKVVIVVDKLLTGFDAVPCAYIYLDKHLQDHGLFQAICRTNRVAQDEEDWKHFWQYRRLQGSVPACAKCHCRLYNRT